MKIENNRMKINIENILLFLLMSIPVLACCYILCPYSDPLKLIPLYFIEWISISIAFYFLSYELGRKGPFLLSIIFILSFLISAIVVSEIKKVYGTQWTGSDDLWYLNQAGKVIKHLNYNNGNLIKAWFELVKTGSDAWSLAGWPFILGVVSFLFNSEPSLEFINGVALSLNATFITLVFIFIVNLLKEEIIKYPYVFLTIFILLVLDPLVFNGYSRKESSLHFSMILLFVFLCKIRIKWEFKWFIVGAFGILGLITLRVVYIPLFLLASFLSFESKIKEMKFIKYLIAIILIGLFWGSIFNIELRDAPLRIWIMRDAISGGSGLGSTIYNIPIVGPVIYYAIAPPPVLPWKIATLDRMFTYLIRSFGSIVWFLSACYVVRGIFKKRELLKNNIFMFALIVFIGIFISAIIISDDPRYKQPSNFYLAIMMFLTWYSRYTKQFSLSDGRSLANIIQATPSRIRWRGGSPKGGSDG